MFLLNNLKTEEFGFWAYDLQYKMFLLNMFQ